MRLFYLSANLLLIRKYFDKAVKVVLQIESEDDINLKIETMRVTKQWLEYRIKELNDWLFENERGCQTEYSLNKHKRDYYVKKLIELEEYGMSSIKI